ncbi:MAG TPA: hypothetical protein PK280_10820 [Planctomycetota bacterium]|nr:hypothetical protein [Planctomycetota bacterium]
MPDTNMPRFSNEELTSRLFSIADELTELVPLAVSRRCRVLPLAKHGDTVFLASDSVLPAESQQLASDLAFMINVKSITLVPVLDKDAFSKALKAYGRLLGHAARAKGVMDGMDGVPLSLRISSNLSHDVFLDLEAKNTSGQPSSYRISCQIGGGEKRKGVEDKRCIRNWVRDVSRDDAERLWAKLADAVIPAQPEPVDGIGGRIYRLTVRSGMNTVIWTWWSLPQEGWGLLAELADAFVELAGVNIEEAFHGDDQMDR